MHPLELGASLYIPAIHNDLTLIAKGEKIQDLRSVFFCTEDSILEEQIDYALSNIADTLKNISSLPNSYKNKQAQVTSCNDLVLQDETKKTNPYIFIRPRNPEVLQRILNIPNIENACGFILPKFTLDNLQDWFSILEKHPNFFCMPTLETADVFDPKKMYALRDALLSSPMKKRVLVLRVGGLDLFNLLSIRRHCDFTIYDTALCHCLRQLVSIFKPAGFNLSAPAFECLNHEEVLRQEAKLDIINGFCVKSTIHPDQIPVIHDVYKVREIDYQVSQALLDPNQPAVFRMDHRMCEKTTHSNWAKRVLLQAKLFGMV